jgi:RND family efflux transporter MFP subunit
MTTILALAGVVACGREPAPEPSAAPPPPSGRVVEVRDTVLPAFLEAAGIAAPVRRATLSTKLMGAVTEVLVREGDRVRAGQVLARVDARDIAAKRAQAAAGVAEAEAVRADAVTQAQRFRALYADSAAARAQLDAAETGLARAEAAVATGRAALRELDAVGAYAQLRAPFAGAVTRRYVDPGAFAAPGAPLVDVEDDSRLRITVMVAPAAAAPLRPGATLQGTVERRAVEARIEGVAPAAGALYRINAVVDNPGGEFPSGGAATLHLPQGSRTALIVPTAAVVREGDLTGVRTRTPAGDVLRWVRLGTATGGAVEVLSGIRSGDRVLVPAGEEAAR